MTRPLGRVHAHLALIFSLLTLFAGSALAGTTYTFTVSCAGSARVVEWGVGDVDPGKEFLRVSTGTLFPDCSITDYAPSSDSHLPREHYEHAEAFWKGIPLIGPILCKIFCPW